LLQENLNDCSCDTTQPSQGLSWMSVGSVQIFNRDDSAAA